MGANLTDFKELHGPGVQLFLQFPISAVHLDYFGVIPETLLVISSEPYQWIAVFQIIIGKRILFELDYFLHRRQGVDQCFTLIGVDLVQNLDELLV